MEMYRRIVFPTANDHIIVLPEAYYGLEVAVIAFPLNDKKKFENDLDAFYNGINLDFSGYKFNRDEANER